MRQWPAGCDGVYEKHVIYPGGLDQCFGSCVNLVKQKGRNDNILSIGGGFKTPGNKAKASKKGIMNHWFPGRWGLKVVGGFNIFFGFDHP